VIELVAVRAGEIAAPDRDDLREHRAGALLHGGGKHTHLATTTVDRAQPHAQGFSDRHLP
jgi:hypothetical protein